MLEGIIYTGAYKDIKIIKNFFKILILKRFIYKLVRLLKIAKLKFIFFLPVLKVKKLKVKNN